MQQSVKSEIQTYSQVFEKSAPEVTVKSLKTAVKEAAIEEDRNRSLMKFGLEEEKGNSYPRKSVTSLNISEINPVRNQRDSAGRLKQVHIGL